MKSELQKLQEARSKANKSKKAAAQARIDAYFFGVPSRGARRPRKAKRRLV
jgi:hypothetical protein